MELNNALKIANGVMDILLPLCVADRIHIAGSCRRGKPEVKDIEICCLPQIFVTKDMFGDTANTVRVSGFSIAVKSLGNVVKGKPDGKMMQIELPEGIMLDLFMPDNFDYFRQYAIRTGSSDYSFRVIANGWREIGWCGSDVGLRKTADCIGRRSDDGKTKWRCVNANAEHPPAWKSEEEFFDWIRVEWIRPQDRE